MQVKIDEIFTDERPPRPVWVTALSWVSVLVCGAFVYLLPLWVAPGAFASDPGFFYGPGVEWGVKGTRAGFIVLAFVFALVYGLKLAPSLITLLVGIHTG